MEWREKMTTYRLTTGDHLRALRLRREGRKWPEIALELKISAPVLRRALDPVWAEHRAGVEYRSKMRALTAQQREQQKRKTLAPNGHQDYVTRRYIPPHVLAERETAMAAGQRDITAEFFGDPPKGRSALDKRASRL
jgi:hypothetical protein